MNDVEGKAALHVRECMKPLVEENTVNIAKLTEVVTKQKIQITNLERELEALKQEARNKTIVIDGLKQTDDKTPSDQIMQLCKDKLQVNLHPHDIDRVFSVPTKKDPRKKLYYVTLTTYRKKEEIMMVKKNLKQNDEKIFINENLTPKQGVTFFMARKLVKEKKLVATWTRDGKVYVKKDENSQSKIIVDKEQLTKYE